MALKYQITNLKLKPAPTIPQIALKSLTPEHQNYVLQTQNWSKQAQQSMEQMAAAIRELQSLQK
jgi:hypothetical protein